MKKYYYKNTYHLFDEDNNYVGFLDEQSDESNLPRKVGYPFNEWKKWDKEKHDYLVFLGFNLIKDN